MELNKITFRQAIKEDVLFVAKIKVDGWKNAYQEIIDKAYLDKMSIDDEVEKINKKYNLKDIYVAEFNEEIIGFCRMYESEKSIIENIDVRCWLKEIYIKPNLKGCGVGGKFFEFIKDIYKNKGYTKLYLGCFRKNYLSRKFYEKNNGQKYGYGKLLIDNIDYEIVTYLFDLQ